MAENEVLDVGNPRHYQRWRRALADANRKSSASWRLHDVASQSGERVLCPLQDLPRIAIKWVGNAESIRRRMANHLRLTNVPRAQDEKVSDLQLRHSREVIHAFGSPFSKYNQSTASSTPETTAIASGERS